MMSEPEKHSPLEIIHDEVFYDHGYARILLRHYKDRLGNKREWGMTHLNTHGPSGIIVAITDQNAIILERSFRVTLKDWIIELPGGCNDKEGEDSSVVARRELLEETGYLVPEVELLATIVDAPGVTDESTDIYLGLHAKKIAEPSLEPAEVIEPLIIPLDEVFSFLTSCPEKCDPKVWAALGFLYERKLITR